MGKAKANDAIVTFIAIPLVMLIGYYLIACTIAPLVGLNNQTFKIIFTLAGGVPTLLFYSNNQIKRN
jgi:hypothetical protein